MIPKFENTFAALFSLLKEEIATTDRDSKIIVYGSEAKILMLYPEVYQCQIQLEIYELHFRLAEAARIRATENFKSAK